MLVIYNKYVIFIEMIGMNREKRVMIDTEVNWAERIGEMFRAFSSSSKWWEFKSFMTHVGFPALGVIGFIALFGFIIYKADQADQRNTAKKRATIDEVRV